MEVRYIKPFSLTWWASFLPLALGILLALEPLHQSLVLVQFIHNFTGGIEPYVLINAGLAGIGMRGAIPPK